MRKSKLVTLGLLALTATIVACDDPSVSSEEVQNCVNSDGVVVDESLCNPGDGGLIQTTDDAGNVIYVPSTQYVGNSGGHPVIFYHWYYGGYSSPLPRGSRINISSGGSWHPSAGHVYSKPSTFGRGGFGGTGRGFSGGGRGGFGGG